MCLGGEVRAPGWSRGRGGLLCVELALCSAAVTRNLRLMKVTVERFLGSCQGEFPV